MRFAHFNGEVVEWIFHNSDQVIQNSFVLNFHTASFRKISYPENFFPRVDSFLHQFFNLFSPLPLPTKCLGFTFLDMSIARQSVRSGQR